MIGPNRFNVQTQIHVPLRRRFLLSDSSRKQTPASNGLMLCGGHLVSVQVARKGSEGTSTDVLCTYSVFDGDSSKDSKTCMQILIKTVSVFLGGALSSVKIY